MTQRRFDAHYLRIGLGVNQARESIARVAADAFARVRIAFVEAHAERRVEWLQSQRRQIIAELLNARLMTDRRKRIWPRSVRLARIFPPLSMHLEQALSFEIVRLEIVVCDGPGRRDPAVVLQDSKVLSAQAEQRGTI